MPADRPAPPVRIPPPPVGWGAGGSPRPRSAAPSPSRRARRIRDADRPTAAMVLGIVSLFANILLLPSLIGILYGARSLRVGTAQRGQAIAGIVCGSVGAAWVLVQLALLVPLALLGPHVDGDRVADSIAAGSARTGTALTDVSCPDPDSVSAGSTITCTGRSAQTGPVSIEVRFTGTSGGFTWRAVQAV